MAIDIFRGTQGVTLHPEVSNEIWTKTQKASAVMGSSRKIELPGRGVSIPIITGDAEASWTNETDDIAVSRPTFATKTITPYKIGVIVPFSKEFGRDAKALYEEIVNRLPLAIAKKFDATVMGLAPVPGSNFDTLATAQKLTVSEKDTYKDLVKIYGEVAKTDQKVSAWLATPEFQSLMMQATDTAGRPLFVPDVATTGQVGSFLGRPIMDLPVSGGDVIGIAGDFAGSAVYGTVGDIEISMSTEATVKDGTTDLHLFSRDMFAVRALVEIGFRIRDDKAFVQIAKATSGGRSA